MGINLILSVGGVSDDPWVTLKVQGYDNIKFKASEEAIIAKLESSFELKNEVKDIVDAVHQAYLTTINRRFN